MPSFRCRLCQGVREKASGAKTDRPELAKLIGRLEPGDVLVVTRLDRLARSTRDLLNVARRDQQARCRLPFAQGCLGRHHHAARPLDADGARRLAEFERELIRARTGEGRKRAKDRGVKFGRPRRMTPHQRQEALQRLAAGEVQADLARSYGVSQATISRLSGDRPFEAGAAGAQ